MPTIPYNHVLFIGATSGIGQAMAARLIREGTSVTAVGRRHDRLDDFVKGNDSDLASAIPFDLTDTRGIPSFVQQVETTHPDIDCLYLNAGIQGRYDFSKPEAVDMQEFNAEINVNFLSLVALAHAFLPFLMNKPSAGIIFTGSNLAFVPAFPLPAYSASKAALNAFVLCLREQLRETTVKVIEISPPPVQSELHDKQMGKEAGRALGMPVDKFTDKAYNCLVTGNEETIIGGLGPADQGSAIGQKFLGLMEKRREVFLWVTDLLQGN